jgi:hypothetical protein
MDRRKLDTTIIGERTEDLSTLKEIDNVITESQAIIDHLLTLTVTEEVTKTKNTVLLSIETDLRAHERHIMVYKKKLADLKSMEEGLYHQVLNTIDTTVLEQQIIQYTDLYNKMDDIITNNFRIDCNDLISQDEFRKLLNLRSCIDDIKKGIETTVSTIDMDEHDLIVKKMESCKRKTSKMTNDIKVSEDKVNEMEKVLLLTASEQLNKQL